MRAGDAMATTGLLSLTSGIVLKYGAVNGIIVFGATMLVVGLLVEFLDLMAEKKK